jgi:hypothetical protein
MFANCDGRPRHHSCLRIVIDDLGITHVSLFNACRPNFDHTGMRSFMHSYIPLPCLPYFVLGLSSHTFPRFTPKLSLIARHALPTRGHALAAISCAVSTEHWYPQAPEDLRLAPCIEDAYNAVTAEKETEKDQDAPLKRKRGRVSKKQLAE